MDEFISPIGVFQHPESSLRSTLQRRFQAGKDATRTGEPLRSSEHLLEGRRPFQPPQSNLRSTASVSSQVGADEADSSDTSDLDKTKQSREQVKRGKGASPFYDSSPCKTSQLPPRCESDSVADVATKESKTQNAFIRNDSREPVVRNREDSSAAPSTLPDSRHDDSTISDVSEQADDGDEAEHRGHYYNEQDLEAADTLLQLSTTTDNVHEAAVTLIMLLAESHRAIRRLNNQNYGNCAKTVRDIIRSAQQNPLGAPKSAAQLDWDNQQDYKLRRLDCALTLIKFSGQSRADSRVALALMYLHRESTRVLHREKVRRAALEREEQSRKALAAQEAIQHRRMAEQAQARKLFRAQYPAVLRTTSREGGKGKAKAVELPDDSHTIVLD